MPYVARSEISAELPPQFLTDALDDDRDGLEDDGLFDAVVASAASDVDGFLGPRFSVPLPDPVPALVRTATKVFVLEKLYMRRGYAGEQNPWFERAQAIRKQLLAIGAGDAELELTVRPANAPAVLIGEKSRIYDQRRVPCLR